MQQIEKVVLERVTITLSELDEGGFYVRSDENKESYVPRWYAAKWETLEEAQGDYRQIVADAKSGERPWGTGGLYAGFLSR